MDIMLQQGTNPTTITRQATIMMMTPPSSGNNYAMNFMGETIQIGGTSSGLYTSHANQALSAYDQDNDTSVGNCSSTKGNTTWWFKDCYDGSFWGDGGMSGPIWTGTTVQEGWGAIWMR